MGARTRAQIGAQIKITWIFLFSLIVLSPLAQATRARLLSLGQDKNGSLFIEDERNIFLNPAFVTKVPNQINLEAGNYDRVSSSRPPATNDTTNDPKAEGGIVYQMPEFSLGTQVGRVSKAADLIDAQPSLTTSFYDPQNGIDLIFGKKAKVTWGASLHYAKSKEDSGQAANPDSEAKILSARGGILNDKYQGYLNWDIMHDSETRTTGGTREFDGKLSLEAGGSYNLNSRSKVGGYILRTKNDFNNGAGEKGDYLLTRLSGQYFYYFKNEKGMMVYGLGGLYYEKGESDYDTATTDKKETYLSIPVGLGFEAGMTSWLKLRGSVAQNVLIDKSDSVDGTNDRKSEGQDDTIVTLGSSLLFQNFSLDATLEGTGSAGSGKVNGNTLMANVGATYNF